jgi:hypothetical protein
MSSRKKTVRVGSSCGFLERVILASVHVRPFVVHPTLSFIPHPHHTRYPFLNFSGSPSSIVVIYTIMGHEHMLIRIICT